LGINTVRGPECFPFARIEEMFANRFKVPTDRAVRHVFVAIDPCGGSAIRETRGSDYAICSIISPGTCIVGMDAMDVYEPGPDIDARIVSHFNQLIAIFQTALIVVAIENLTGMEHERIAVLLTRTFPRRVIIMREKLIKAGVGATPAIKRDMMELTRLGFEAGEIVLAEKLCTR